MAEKELVPLLREKRFKALRRRLHWRMIMCWPTVMYPTKAVWELSCLRRNGHEAVGVIVLAPPEILATAVGLEISLCLGIYILLTQRGG